MNIQEVIKLELLHNDNENSYSIISEPIGGRIDGGWRAVVREEAFKVNEVNEFTKVTRLVEKANVKTIYSLPKGRS